ncbi:MAG: hypothetical protein EHM17_03715 [Verrucomicrobiaceae bacterium]|nr:MAG: hypothetical protein EHM17_03715 [Verrucomicrobiaceae bacterium]
MRWILTCLLLLGLCAGLQGRALAADPCEVLAAMHEHGESDHHHDPGKPCDPEHDKNCPLDHHGHSCFCHAMPLADVGDPLVRLRVPCLSIGRLRHERETAPDGPFLSEDKPPLI